MRHDGPEGALIPKQDIDTTVGKIISFFQLLALLPDAVIL